MGGAAAASGEGGHGKDSYVGTLEDAVLANTNQFYKWHSELEAACASETEEKYKRYADLLNSHLKSCEFILAKVRMGARRREGFFGGGRGGRGTTEHGHKGAMREVWAGGGATAQAGNVGAQAQGRRLGRAGGGRAA